MKKYSDSELSSNISPSIFSPVYSPFMQTLYNNTNGNGINSLTNNSLSSISNNVNALNNYQFSPFLLNDFNLLDTSILDGPISNNNSTFQLVEAMKNTTPRLFEDDYLSNKIELNNMNYLNSDEKKKLLITTKKNNKKNKGNNEVFSAIISSPDNDLSDGTQKKKKIKLTVSSSKSSVGLVTPSPNSLSANIYSGSDISPNKILTLASSSAASLISPENSHKSLSIITPLNKDNTTPSPLTYSKVNATSTTVKNVTPLTTSTNLYEDMHNNLVNSTGTTSTSTSVISANASATSVVAPSQITSSTITTSTGIVLTTNNINNNISICNCKKSKCLKLYCDCFAALVFCNPTNCNCTQCFNNINHIDTRNEAIKLTKERNSFAFTTKISVKTNKVGSSIADPNSGSNNSTDKTLSNYVHITGCHCKNSHCLKKYCECFNGGAICGTNCKCQACKNFSGSVDLFKAREIIIQKQQQQQQQVSNSSNSLYLHNKQKDLQLQQQREQYLKNNSVTSSNSSLSTSNNNLSTVVGSASNSFIKSISTSSTTTTVESNSLETEGESDFSKNKKKFTSPISVVNVLQTPSTSLSSVSSSSSSSSSNDLKQSQTTPISSINLSTPIVPSSSLALSSPLTKSSKKRKQFPSPTSVSLFSSPISASTAGTSSLNLTRDFLENDTVNIPSIVSPSPIIPASIHKDIPLYNFFNEKISKPMPKVVALKILEHLDGKSLYNMSQVNSLWNQAVLDEALWE